MRNTSPREELTCKTFSKNLFKAYKKEDDTLELEQSCYIIHLQMYVTMYHFKREADRENALSHNQQ
jgi:hypothetical protein